MTYKTTEVPEILIVEDNPADRMLILEALSVNKELHRCQVAEDGEAAISLLRQSGSKGERYRPNLVLLDLNLPRKDGFEVLAEIKADPELRSIPVVVMTSSESPQDINVCYEAGANCYVVKAFGLDHFLTTIGNIEKFWLSVATLPIKQKSNYTSS